MKTKLAVLLTFVVIMFGCTAPENVSTDDPNKDGFNTVRLSLPSSDDISSIGGISNVSVYIFINNIFMQVLTNLETREDGTLSIPAPRGSMLFFLTNTAPPVSYSELREGESTMSEFLALSSNPDAQHSATRAPESFSGSFDSTDGTTQIRLKRSVARLDLDVSRDALFKVTKVVVKDANAITNMFPNSSKAKHVAQSYEKSFEPAITGIHTDMFRIYESATPVMVTIYGTYNGIPTIVQITIPHVERNLSYTLKVNNVGATITGSFETVPWGDGGTVEGQPDIKEKILIDQDNTLLTDGVTADYTTNVVDVSASGGEFTLGFISSAEVQLASIEGVTPDVQVVRVGVEDTESGFLTKYTVTVAEQGKGRLSYSVVLNLKNALMTGSYNQVSINVAPSPVQMATVDLGGKTWMAFNARTRDLDDQIYQTQGATVLEMYENHWISTIGGMYQWGRIFMYTPWHSYPSRPGDQVITKEKWVDDTHVPCPEGYRVPSKTELRALLPLNQPVPGEYDYNGERIAIDKHTSATSSVVIDGVAGTARYVTLTSKTTGEQLIIPLAGHKGDKSTAKSPGFGSMFALWTGDRHTLGGWSSASLFSFDNGSLDGEGQYHDMIEAESYAYVRCIKK